jgi:hypothetical protein
MSHHPKQEDDGPGSSKVAVKGKVNVNVNVKDDEHQEQAESFVASNASSSPFQLPPPEALYNVDVTASMGSSDYVRMFEDILRMLCIQFTIQVMLYFSGDASSQFFSREFVLLLMYVELGVLLYWLVIRKLIKFT